MSGDNHPQGSVERVLHALTVGTAQAIRRKDQSTVDNKPSEMEQQYQLSIKGTAGTLIAAAEATVHFTHAYYFAPADRNSSLAFPQFTFGSHISSPTPVMVVASVMEWLHNERNGAVIGAKLAVMVLGSGAFTGYIHLTFQGYGALIEPDEELLVNDGLEE